MTNGDDSRLPAAIAAALVRGETDPRGVPPRLHSICTMLRLEVWRIDGLEPLFRAERSS